MAELTSWRKQLDALDFELIELLAKRFAVNREVRRYKDANGLSVTDPERERAMLEERVRLAEEHGIDGQFTEDLYRHILAYVKGDKL
jgi:chorismate mutase-like protein